MADVPDDRLVLEEAARRINARAAVQDVVDGLYAELFDKQIDFINDPAREKGALCTRRAGKTSMWVRHALAVGLMHPRSIIRIWGISRLRTKQLLWDEFKLCAARHRITYSPNETELTLKLPNGSEIRLLGADKDKEAEKKRGDKTRLEIVLEAQLFGPYLQNLVENVAKPCLFDLQGTFCLEGTPGPLCVGYWWEVSGREDFASHWDSIGGKDGLGAGWSMHRWSVLDNPFLPHARVELAREKKQRRWTDDAPTYVREWLGRWVNDLGMLFYKFDPTRNIFGLDEVKPWGPGWEHVLGWDLGARDDMAIVVWGFHPHKTELYEAFSWKEPGALSPKIVSIIRQLERAGVDGTPFNISAKVADTGGGGRMFVNEVTSRYGMSFEAAQKTEKYEHVRLMNDDLAGGFVKLRQGSEYAEELSQLARDQDWPPPDMPEKPPREDPRCANHCSDAGLYAYRRAWHYLHQDEPAIIMPGTEHFWQEEAKRMERMVLERSNSKRRGEWRFGTPEDDAEFE